MFLRRLELVGFKSFAARTVLELDPAIDVIVGPNGSGKSNLADAVRWVLGEQSMRAVRSKRSEDVIFAGSASRAPLGMAEVSLILDNSDERLPLPFAEVRVTRRLYRSGESEYLLNGSRVRLKDITECLTHAGLGPDSYCVIGQGAVEELILQRPEERRLAFESAADIRRHQLKLAETRSRLESTEQNLTRCQDVMAELEPHLRRLRGQAERAERARRLRGELAGLATAWYRRRLGEARQALERAEAAYQAAETERQRLEAALAEHEAAQQELDAVAEATERRLRELRPRVEALRAEHEAVQREAAVAEERLAQLGQRLSDDGPDLQELRERVARLEAEASAARQARDEQEAALGAQRQRLAAARERLHVEEQELARRQRVLVTLEREHAQKVAQRDELERQRAAAEPRAEAAQREASDSAAARAEAEQALGELQARLAAERERARALEQQAQAGAAESAHARQDQAEAARRVADLQQAVLAAEREAARLEAALRQLAPGRAAPAATTLPPSAGELGAALLGLLGERLYIPAAYELALAAGLDGLARALVLRCSVDRERLAASLLQARGRWTLLALEAADGAETRAFQRQARARLAGCTVHGFGDELLESPPELAPLVAACLGRTVVVDDSDLLEAYGRLTAEEELARPWQVVSLSGHRARSGGEWLVGLGAEVDPLLSIERERRRLAAELAVLRERLPALETELAERRRAQEQAGERLRALAQARAGQEAELRQSRAQAQELERQLARREQERRRAEERLAAAQRTHEQLARDRAARDQAAQGCARELEALGTQLQAARAAAQEQGRRVGALRGELGATQTETAVQEAQLRSAATLAERVAGEASLARQALERAMGERTRAQQQRHAQAQALAERQARLAAVGAELGPQREALGALEASLEQQAEARRHRDEALGATRRLVRVADEAHEAASLARERARDELERLRREAAEALQLDDEGGAEEPLQLRLALDAPEGQTGPAGEPAVDQAAGQDLGAQAARLPGSRAGETPALPGGEPIVDMAAARRRINALQRELRTLGAVNEGALEEFREMAERQAFLSSQSDDLRVTIAELRQAIGELEALMAERFSATFQRVDAAFQETFITLFGGGAAQLVLTRPENLLETGIDVVARPPGKRLQGLMSLSGGERALTSVALLFALLSVNPTPFVLLDEVDAALDESNVQRFANLLKGYAKGIQFIVVTHNRATMEIGSALFGVSMEASGVTRVLSLRLADAEVSEPRP